MKEAVVFLASGGLDSTVGMAKALEEYDIRVYPLHVNRGQRAQHREISALAKIIPFLMSRYQPCVAELAIVEMTFPLLEWKGWYNLKDVERLGHPMRDIILQSIGVQYAEYVNSLRNEHINTVMIGQTSDEVMPHASDRALTLASFLVQLDRDDEAWSIRSPLLYPKPMTKAETLRWGIEHRIPVQETWSCFLGRESPCGKCQECLRRESAFKQCV